jgi:sirohydrochlorin cobaltochelatase
MKRGLLLFAHGARDPRWALPFEEVAQRIRQREPDLKLELAFLEFMEPDLMTAGRRLAELGCERVDVVPLFLGAGGHVRKELPALLLDLSARHASVRWNLHQAVGEVDSVIDAMALAALENTRQT